MYPQLHQAKKPTAAVDKSRHLARVTDKERFEKDLNPSKSYDLAVQCTNL